MSGARTQILIAAVLFGTTGTAQALGPELDPLAVGASRIAVGGALLTLVALVAAATGRLRLRTGGGPDVFTVEAVGDYGGQQVYVTSIIEFRHSKIVKQTD